MDGFNLYHGMRDAGYRHCYWLNVRAMASLLLKPPYLLKMTKYFTARVSGGRPGDTVAKASEREASRRRQQVFLEALGTLKALAIYEGHFLLKRDSCRACGANFLRPEEKATDVRLACEFVADAFLDVFDAALIVSADSDLVPPIETVRAHFPEKHIAIAFPPLRSSWEMTQINCGHMKIWQRTLERSQLPDEVIKQDGTKLSRPVEWQ